jgi:hypothetical protein
MTPPTLLAFMHLFPEFRASSWDGWRGVLGRLTESVREFYAIVGRGGGKSRIAALLASYFATRPYQRAPGESIYIGVFAPDRKQAGLTFRYVLGLLQSVPALARLIASQTKDSIELANGVVIEVITASIAAPRGRAYALVIVEEAAFLPNDQSANPDVELLRAVRPALARVPGSLLAVISSPYARKGILWDAYRRHHGQPDGRVVVVHAPTLQLNPRFDREAIATAYVEDEASARAEFGGEFRGDLETFVAAEAIGACVVPGRLELPPASGTHYLAFVDPSGGSADSMTLAIAHAESDQWGVVGILDCVREVAPPFSPESTVGEFAEVLRRYGCAVVVGDHYGGQWPQEQFRKSGIQYQLADRPKSEIYRELLAPLNSESLELLDHPRLLAQLQGLERRTGRGGRDTIDHAPNAHDDVINAAAGALLLAVRAGARAPVRMW